MTIAAVAPLWKRLVFGYLLLLPLFAGTVYVVLLMALGVVGIGRGRRLTKRRLALEYALVLAVIYIVYGRRLWTGG